VSRYKFNNTTGRGDAMGSPLASTQPASTSLREIRSSLEQLRRGREAFRALRESSAVDKGPPCQPQAASRVPAAAQRQEAPLWAAEVGEIRRMVADLQQRREEKDPDNNACRSTASEKEVQQLKARIEEMEEAAEKSRHSKLQNALQEKVKAIEEKESKAKRKMEECLAKVEDAQRSMETMRTRNQVLEAELFRMRGKFTKEKDLADRTLIRLQKELKTTRRALKLREDQERAARKDFENNVSVLRANLKEKELESINALERRDKLQSEVVQLSAKLENLQQKAKPLKDVVGGLRAEIAETDIALRQANKELARNVATLEMEKREVDDLAEKERLVLDTKNQWKSCQNQNFSLMGQVKDVRLKLELHRRQNINRLEELASTIEKARKDCRSKRNDVDFMNSEEIPSLKGEVKKEEAEMEQGEKRLQEVEESVTTQTMRGESMEQDIRHSRITISESNRDFDRLQLRFADLAAQVKSQLCKTSEADSILSKLEEDKKLKKAKINALCLEQERLGLETQQMGKELVEIREKTKEQHKSPAAKEFEEGKIKLLNENAHLRRQLSEVMICLDSAVNLAGQAEEDLENFEQTKEKAQEIARKQSETMQKLNLEVQCSQEIRDEMCRFGSIVEEEHDELLALLDHEDMLKEYNESISKVYKQTQESLNRLRAHKSESV